MQSLVSMPFSDIHQRFLYLPSLITADGNIKSLRIGTDLITDYAYDLNKNLTTIRTTLGGGSIVCDNKYTYDGNGNRLSKADRQGLTKYAYDDFGRLASTVTAEGDIQKNCYDAEGLRAEMDENAKTYYHYVCDGQGSVSHIIRGEDKESGVSEQGREQDREQDRILNHYEYDAFGNTISCKEQVENRFRYQGEQYDPITRQYYLRARYYNPVIGRFTQEDTYYGDGLNLYEYCRNNTITYKDPTGHNICATQRDLYHKYKEEGMSPQEAYQKMRKDLGLDSKSGYKDSGVGNGKDPWRSYESGSSSVNDIVDIMKSGNMTTDGRNIITQLDENTKVIFRMDVGENAHSMEMYGYSNPVNHINIEIQVKASSGKYKPKWNFHMILDNLGEVSDSFATGIWTKK